MRPNINQLLLLFVFVLSLVGCGGSSGGSTENTGRATLQIIWPESTRLIPIASKSITVSFLDGQTVIASKTVPRPASGNESIVSFENLPAITLTLKAEAFPNENGTGVAQASATKSVTIVRNETIQVAITMDSTITSFVITPTSPVIAVGDDVQLTATALDRMGRTVLVTAATRSFTSSNPGVATVDNAGLVTGVSEGSTTITVRDTESGVSKSVVVAVSNSGTASTLQLAQAYLNTLTSTQRAATVAANTATNAAKWSHLAATPNGDGTNNLRNGVSFSSLTADQKAAWVRLVQAALGEEGYSRLGQIRAADEYLGSRASGFSGDFFYVGFVGEPTDSGNWILQISGYNFAANLTFQGATLMSTTPYYLGVEPNTFTLSGLTFAPMQDKRDAMFNLVNSLSTAQSSLARLSSNFSNVLLGPGMDARSNFPTANRGLLASGLSTAQQTLLMNAIAAWTQDSPLGDEYLALYDAELAQTYVAISGATGLDAQGDYVRIDGPHVWIELLVKNGVVVSGQLQYQSVWRDRISDYNNAYGF